MGSAAEEIVIFRENELLPNRELIRSLKARLIVWAHNFSKPETLAKESPDPGYRAIPLREPAAAREPVP